MVLSTRLSIEKIAEYKAVASANAYELCPVFCLKRPLVAYNVNLETWLRR